MENNNKLRKRIAAITMAAALLAGPATGCANSNGDNPPTAPGLTSSSDVVNPSEPGFPSSSDAVNPPEDLAPTKIKIKESLVDFWNEQAIKEEEGIPTYSLGNQMKIAQMLNATFEELDGATTESELNGISEKFFGKIAELPTFEKERAEAREGLTENEKTPWDKVKIVLIMRNGSYNYDEYVIAFENAIMDEIDVDDITFPIEINSSGEIISASCISSNIERYNIGRRDIYAMGKTFYDFLLLAIVNYSGITKEISGEQVSIISEGEYDFLEKNEDDNSNSKPFSFMDQNTDLASYSLKK